MTINIFADKKQRTANSGLCQAGGCANFGASCFYLSSALVDNFCARTQLNAKPRSPRSQKMNVYNATSNTITVRPCPALIFLNVP